MFLQKIAKTKKKTKTKTMVSYIDLFNFAHKPIFPHNKMLFHK